MSNSLGLISAASINESAQLTLNEAKSIAQQSLSKIASSKDFAIKFAIAFGDTFDAAKAEDLRQEWLAGNFDSLPPIEIRSAAELNGANGAFSSNANKIYLTQQYIAQNASNPQAIASVLLEEIGHFVDSQINFTDSLGDEGAIFSALIQGETLAPLTLQQMKAEDDTTTITLNNQVLQIEQSADPNYIAALTKDANNTGVHKWASNTLTYSFMSSLPDGYSSNDYPSFSPLDAQQQAAVVKALATWADVANLSFSPVGNDVQLHTEDIVSSTLLGQIKAEYYLIFGAIGSFNPITGLIGLAAGEVMYQAFRAGLDDYIDSLNLVKGANLYFGSYDLADGSAGHASLPDRSQRTTQEGEYKQLISDYINSWILSDNLGLQVTYEDIDVSEISDARLYSGGNVFIDNLLPQNAGSQIGISGSDGFDTLVHEIGHALGLSHPGNYDAGDNPPPGPYLEAKYDNARYSVMSYNKAEWQGNVSPSTPMLYDIAAIQHLYGVNANVRSGNTTYSWNPNTPFMMTIWDAGGTDTIDASNQLAFDTPTDLTFDSAPSYSTFASNSPDTVLTLENYGVEIDLNPGSFSSIGSTTFGSYVRHATNNLAIAFGVTIENAIGTTGNDSLIGNDVDNVLQGGDGDDSMEGRGGADNLQGEDGNDTISSGTGNDTVDGGSGIDKVVVNYSSATSGIYWGLYDSYGRTGGYLSGSGVGQVVYYNIEQFQITGGAYNDRLYGAALDDSLIGGAGNDTLDAGAGNDTLDAGAGNDTLIGGAGTDQLTGGAGADRFYFYTRTEGSDTITDFNVVDDAIYISSSFGGGLTAGTAVTTAQFTLGSSASDSSDRFIYNQSTGALFFDTDGTGLSKQIQIAQLSTGLVMTNQNIIVFA